MKYLIIGVGLLGYEVAKRLMAQGDTVIGTTTTPAKLELLETVCSSAVVLTGDDRDKIWEVGSDCDAIIITVSPRLSQARSPKLREAEYKRTFANTCLNATQANSRCIFNSSFSVYGDGGIGEGEVTEESPLSISREPSTKYYRMAEELIMSTGRGVVLRLPDMYGGGQRDLTYTQRVQFAVDKMGGRVPFSASALFYRLHALDAARAIVHVLDKGLAGVYNVCDNSIVPPTNEVIFNRLTDEAELPRLTFLGQIKLPTRPVSSAKLSRTGFSYEFTDYKL